MKRNYINKLTFLGLLSLLTLNVLYADEYISEAYFEEVSADSEINYELNESIVIWEEDESLPSLKTVDIEYIEPINLVVESKSIIPWEDNEILPMNESIPLVVEEKVISDLVKIELEKKNVFTNSPYGKALLKARSEKKVIMLVIRSTNCKYCDKMERGTLVNPSVLNILDSKFITLHYNQDLDVLPLGFKNGMTPNFVFVNTNEDILNQYPGMKSPEAFKEVLEEILAM